MTRDRRGGPDREASGGDRVGNAVRELREYALGRLGEVTHRDVLPHAGLADGDEADLLEIAARAYDPTAVDDPAERARLPADVTDTAMYREVVQSEATETATQAVRRGNAPVAEYTVGWPEYENDVSGYQSIRELENWLMWRDSCKVGYMAANMGKGKTDFGLLLLEIALHATRHRPEEPDAELMTNISSAARQNDDIGLIQTEERLTRWMREGDHRENKWFLFDEASSEISGYASDREKVEQRLSSLIKKMRKAGCNLLVIGHTGKDVHPDIRRLADFIRKKSRKKASIYAGVQSKGDRVEGRGEILSVDGVPQTSFHFDTEDSATWEWDDEEPEETEDTEALLRDTRNAYLREIYRHTDLSQNDMADALDVSKSTVNAAVNDDAAEPVV